MTTTKIHEHNPMFSAISEVSDEQFTFCQDCENNISRYWLDFGFERLSQWSEWAVN